MLGKFIKIQNVGVFKDYHNKGVTSFDFSKNNIIIAENGNGKTTLSSILDSFCKEKSDIILGRKTIGSEGNPSIEMMYKGKNVKFCDKWSDKCEDLEIYNNDFVHENIFIGNEVNVEQKKNLLNFAIGSDGVFLNKRLEKVDERIKVLNKQDIKVSETKIETYIKSSKYEIDLKRYLLLEDDTEIDIKIQQEEEFEDSFRNKEKILAIPNLAEVLFEMPNLELISEDLKENFESLSVEAEKKVTERVSILCSQGGMKWLEDGTEMIPGNNRCPYCGQDITDVEIIKDYKAFFSKEYNNYKERVLSNIRIIYKSTDKSNVLEVYNAISRNKDNFNIWTKYLDFKSLDIRGVNITNIETKLDTLLSDIESTIKDKKENLLDKVLIDSEIIKVAELVSVEIENYNNNILNINKIIQEYKNDINTKIKFDNSKLIYLKMIKERFSMDVVQDIKKYNELLKEKEKLTDEKKLIMKDLKILNENIMEKYSVVINDILEKFGSSFKICDFITNYTGGAKLDYKIQINGTNISLSTNGDNINPQFKNTLSDGDKSALAFSFFIARLRQLEDKELSDKIIVVDDPISSMDLHRIDTTANELKYISSKAKQLIVLTHNINFAKLLFDKLKYIEKAKVIKISQGNLKPLTDKEIDKINISEYFINYYKMKSYVDGSEDYDDEEIIKCMRPFLESHLRMHYPEEFLPTQWLGDFIKNMRGNPSRFKSFINNKRLQELEEINEYSSPTHHGSTYVKATTSSIAVKSFARRTFDFIEH